MNLYYDKNGIELYNGDCLAVMKQLPPKSIDMVMTSPPYWALRDYRMENQVGIERTYEEYVSKLCCIFDEIKRVLKDAGTCWVNIGDTYGGTKNHGNYIDPKYPGRYKQHRGLSKNTLGKCLLQIPARFAIEMINRGWILRNEIIWHKPNCMPDSAKDRFVVDYEKLFLFVKQKKYYFETQYEPYLSTPVKRCRDKSKEKYANTGLYSSGARNYYAKGERIKRCVWKIPLCPSSESHYAMYPENLCVTPILAGSPVNGTVLDPFSGSGTTVLVAKKLDRKAIGIELNPTYCDIAINRLEMSTYEKLHDVHRRQLALNF
jgi:site-specific DNA-methyltransferase (adenine-specific)